MAVNQHYALKDLLVRLQKVTASSKPLPFALYTANTEQKLRNLRLINPVLMFVLSGRKEIELQNGVEVVLREGECILLANRQSIVVRNIPDERPYFALIIEFYPSDKPTSYFANGQTDFIVKPFDETFTLLLGQFVEWANISPPELWENRRQELAKFIQVQGWTEVQSLWREQGLSDQVQRFLQVTIEEPISAHEIAQHFGMSESTLRRRLKDEQTSLQQLKDDVRLGLGLHLLQSTSKPILHIALECGYQSQSRFSERFKEQFGMSPSEVRKNELTGKGESLMVNGK